MNTTIRLFKDIARPPYHALQAAVRRAKGMHRLAAVERDLKRRVPQLITTVSDRDEMLLYSIRSDQDRRLALASYFRVGEILLNDLSKALQRGGLPLHRATSILDFACGYGRVTRWLVAACGRELLTASDIDPRAVDFVHHTFGVTAFTSAKSAQKLSYAGRFDAIFVVSLFSHLAIEYWSPWAAKLIGMLNPDGRLVFSTHGMSLHEGRQPHIKALFREVEPGFVYNEMNETLGRLEGEYYGSADVDEAFVRRAFQGIGEIIDYAPKGLAQYQDLYVARRHA